jgi:hypothetical protein
MSPIGKTHWIAGLHGNTVMAQQQNASGASHVE